LWKIAGNVRNVKFGRLVDAVSASSIYLNISGALRVGHLRAAAI
jgi:hypothetical protein